MANFSPLQMVQAGSQHQLPELLLENGAPQLAPVEQPSALQMIGRAMMSSAAQGPGNWGQMIGRAGLDYYGQQDAIRQAEISRMLLQQKMRAAELEAQKTQAEIGRVGAETTKIGAETEGAKVDAIDKQLAMDLKKVNAANTWLSSAKDQESYGRAMGMVARTLGAEAVKGMPQAYDPAAVAQLGEATRTAQERIQAEMERKRLDETGRHNQASESIQGGQLAETRRHNQAAESRDSQRLEILRDKLDAKPGAAQLPTPALKLQNAELEDIGALASVNSDLSGLQTQLESGKIKLGLGSNLLNRGLNVAGMSTEDSRNFATMKATLERMRNESLRLNKGVQTEGDAQRAWNELFENINDQNVVKQRLSEIQKTNERAINLKKMQVDSIRANYGAEPLEVDKFTNVEPAVGSKPAASGGWGIKRIE